NSAKRKRGVGTRVHRVPFQCAISCPLSAVLPTAQASRADRAATPFRTIPGTRTGLHAVPFQCSIAAPVLPCPAAQASRAEVAATELRTSGTRPRRGTGFQAVPFHRKITADPPRVFPTAQALRAEVTHTPLSSTGPSRG